MKQVDFKIVTGTEERFTNVTTVDNGLIQMVFQAAAALGNTLSDMMGIGSAW